MGGQRQRRPGFERWPGLRGSRALWLAAGCVSCHLSSLLLAAGGVGLRLAHMWQEGWGAWQGGGAGPRVQAGGAAPVEQPDTAAPRVRAAQHARAASCHLPGRQGQRAAARPPHTACPGAAGPSMLAHAAPPTPTPPCMPCCQPVRHAPRRCACGLFVHVSALWCIHPGPGLPLPLLGECTAGPEAGQQPAGAVCELAVLVVNISANVGGLRVECGVLGQRMHCCPSCELGPACLATRGIAPGHNNYTLRYRRVWALMRHAPG